VTPADLKDALRGVISFATTPFDDRHDLDLEGLSRNIAAMADSGVHFIAVAGAVGEFYALTFDEYRAVIRTSIEAAGDVPVLVGIGHSTRIACDLARCAEEAGAAGLLINPLYLTAPGTEGFYQHHRALADASSLGQIVFSTQGHPFDAETLERLAEVDNVIGLKDELGDLGLFLGAVERLGDRFAWIDGMAEPYTAPYFAAGATSVTTGLANFAPEIPLAIYRAAAAGEYERCRQLVAEQVSGLAALRRKRPGYHIAVIKEAMEELGWAAGPCRLPLTPLAPEDRRALRQILTDLDLPSRPRP
jgi:5-dehydro-4-deoxyglucarate dehydratase